MKRTTIALCALLWCGCASQQPATPPDEPEAEEIVEQPPAEPSPDLFEPLREAYRNALFQTNKGQESARESLEKLEAELNKIKASADDWPAPYSEARDRTRQSLKSIDDALKQAASEAETDLGRAHETLERVRENLAKLRGELGVEHPSDAMTHFHTEMEEVTARAKQDAIDWEKESKSVVRLREQLDEISARFRAAREDNCKTANLEQALQSLGTSVDEQNADAFRQAAGNLKKAFVALFKQCG